MAPTPQYPDHPRPRLTVPHPRKEHASPPNIPTKIPNAHVVCFTLPPCPPTTQATTEPRVSPSAPTYRVGSIIHAVHRHSSTRRSISGGAMLMHAPSSPRYSLLITASILSVAGSLSPAHVPHPPLCPYHHTNQSFNLLTTTNYHLPPPTTDLTITYHLPPPPPNTYHHLPTPTTTHHYLHPPSITYHLPTTTNYHLPPPTTDLPTCFQRSSGETIPGCTDDGGCTNRDYWYDPLATQQPTGGNVANDKNLLACTGECDSVGQCTTGLSCFLRASGEAIPGCTGDGGGFYWDYCYDPLATQQPSGGNDANAKNLLACTGECDSDGQCATGLTCSQRSSGAAIPG